MKTVCRPIRHAIRACGWDIVRFNGHTNIDVRRQALLKRLGVTCVLDIGANIGEYAATLRRFGYHGQIISIEPTLEAFRVLQTRGQGDSKWTTKRFAVSGRSGRCKIHVSANSVSSSLLDRTTRMSDAFPESEYVHSESVESITLAELLDDTVPNIMWAKLDVQGSLGNILSATSGHFRTLAALEVEVALTEMYKGEPLFADVIQALQHEQFELVSLESNTIDRKCGAILEVNAMLVRSDARGWRNQ